MIRYRSSLLLLLTLALLCRALGQESNRQREEKLVDLFTRAYSLLEKDPHAAAEIFRRIIALDSSNILACRQLGSIYVMLGKSEEALDCFIRANALLPSDTTRLQIAYLLNALGRNGEALEAFTQLSESTDTTMRATARSAVVVVSSSLCADTYPLWGHLYAAPYYDSRFNNLILMALLRGGKYLDTNRCTSLLADLSLYADTRSAGGYLPVIYSDNYILAGAGIRLQPFRGFIGDVEGGITLDLVRRPDKNLVNFDFRAVASYGAGWYPDIHVPEAATFPLTPFAEGYGSLGYYTRYRNMIGYLQGRAGTRVFEKYRSALDLYGLLEFAIDTEREYYNNIVEAGIGVRIIPDHLWGVSLNAEYHRGTYWGTSSMPNPYERWYSSIRLFLVYDKFLCW